MNAVLEVNMPEPARMVHALSQIGYRLEDAISDLVDNSITAGASTVLIRFMHDGERLISVAIADDGLGMTERQLGKSMRFGSPADTRENTLGKFGMGLKLASLSHSTDFTVFSKRNGKAVAKRWSTENIAAGWMCETRPPQEAKDTFEKRWANMDHSSAGTIVVWNQLKEMPSHKRGARSALGIIERKLRLHLGLTFHRFLQDGRLAIKMDQQLVNHRIKSFNVSIPPLDPFAYDSSGDSRYPLKMSSGPLDGIGHLKFEAHIWPPKSEAPEYRLGRRASSYQGLFIYRNDRLIQSGGWNGLVNDESEPHSSLARIKLDLPIELDGYFNLNVQKSAIVTPLGFEEAMIGARSSSGIGWEDFRKNAIGAYRQGENSSAVRDVMPGRGFPKALAKAYRSQGGLRVSLKIELDMDEPLKIDLVERSLHVDQSFVDSLGGEYSKGWEVFLLMLFQLVRPEFNRKTLSNAVKAKLDSLLEILARL